MRYPCLSDYHEAVQHPDESFRVLTDLVYADKPVPYFSEDASSHVFKMKSKSTGKYYALKCFLGERDGLIDNYPQISAVVNGIDSPYFVHVQYLENEILVKSHNKHERYPVLLMDWVDGMSMRAYMMANYKDRHAMDVLCYRFCKMAAWLRSQPFAHGDITTDNVMVRPDGSLTLIDYDCMYAPSMKEWNSYGRDTFDFVHPLWPDGRSDASVDDFALACMALSLKVISLRPSLIRRTGSTYLSLFDADQCFCCENNMALSIVQELLSDDDVKRLYALYLMACADMNLDSCAPDMFVVEDPEYKYELLSTRVTDDDLANAVTDSFGVKYSKDGKRLLKASDSVKGSYTVKEGTRVICDNAFSHCFLLSYIIIHKGVTTIGDRAFDGCGFLRNIVIPCSVVRMGVNPFLWCHARLHVLSTDFKREKSVLFDKEKKKIISVGSGMDEYTVPDGVTTIGAGSFEGCGELSCVKLPDSVTTIEEGAFNQCSSLKRIVIPSGVTSIADYTFLLCESLTSIVLPDSVTSVGYGAFGGCDKLRPSIRKAIIARYGKSVFEW